MLQTLSAQNSDENLHHLVKISDTNEMSALNFWVINRDDVDLAELVKEIYLD